MVSPRRSDTGPLYRSVLSHSLFQGLTFTASLVTVFPCKSVSNSPPFATWLVGSGPHAREMRGLFSQRQPRGGFGILEPVWKHVLPLSLTHSRTATTRLPSNCFRFKCYSFTIAFEFCYQPVHMLNHYVSIWIQTFSPFKAFLQSNFMQQAQPLASPIAHAHGNSTVAFLLTCNQ